MKELRKSFTGIGQVKGFEFTQVSQSDTAYIYRVNTGNNIYYEVFNRKENKRFECISYPTNNAFGLWAWTYNDTSKAEAKFDELDINKK